MTKKSKSQDQIHLLKTYYHQKPHFWAKSQLIQISKRTGLKRHQVYKWLWDQRNLAKQQLRQNQKNLKTKTIYNQNCTQSKTEVNSNIVLISQKYKVRASLPENIQSPEYIKISAETSQWARKVLIQKGWELIKRTECIKQKQINKISIFDIVDQKLNKEELQQQK